jgi:hypothetical protein
MFSAKWQVGQITKHQLSINARETPRIKMNEKQKQKKRN